MKKLLFLVTIFAICGFFVFACGGEDTGISKVEDLPVDLEVTISGLDGPVDVVQDDRGMPHIFASTEHDAFMIQGYLMAKDRIVQLAFMRRVIEGKLAEIAYMLSPTTVDMDIGARQVGFNRLAESIYQSIDPDSDKLKALQAFSDGVNVHINEIRNSEAVIPGGAGALVRPVSLQDWTPQATLAIARYMTHDLSESAADEIAMTEARVAIAEEFPADSDDPVLAARANMFHDFWSFAPAENVFSREGLPNIDQDSGSRAFNGPLPLPPVAELPSRSVLRKARQFMEKTSDNGIGFQGIGTGSNNWVVSGSKTASGYTMMASDPHLSLQSPHNFWYVHLNTKRSGGELNAQGLALFGAPGVLLGYNEDVSWGLTVAYFDAEDVYQETITPGTDGNPDTVLFNGTQVPIETITEIVKLSTGEEVSVDFEIVPHHGMIIPGSRTETSALSTRWVGNEVSDELGTVYDMMFAKTVEDVETALDDFKVGSENWAVAFSNGDIYWTTSARIPIRSPQAMTYDPATGLGYAPSFVLPGTGDYEWTNEDVSDRYLPHDLNPEKGYIATANNDHVGNGKDGNPFNDEYYLSWEFAPGFRMATVDRKLKELTERGNVTITEMSELQNNAISPLGSKLTTAIVASIDRAKEEYDSAGTHPDLTAAVALVGDDFDKLLAMRDRLAGWTSYDTPDGVDGFLSQEEIDDSVATSIFNVTLSRVVNLAFEDEVARIGVRPKSNFIGKTILWILTEPERLNSYDAELGDSVLWDDIDTPDVKETKDDRIVRAMASAYEFLVSELGTDMDEWRWGKLHTLTLESLVPGFDEYKMPAPGWEYTNGYPRHGDNFCVDASHYGVWSTEDYSYGAGPQQRVVAEMAPGGPIVVNAIPGGQEHDPMGEHHADEIEHWRRNRAPILYFKEKDIVEHAEKRILFMP
jgi:penicillin amidase